jgi:hypothetical protein
MAAAHMTQRRSLRAPALLRGVALAAALLVPGWAAAQEPAAIDRLLGQMYPQLDTLTRICTPTPNWALPRPEPPPGWRRNCAA